MRTSFVRAAHKSLLMLTVLTTAMVVPAFASAGEASSGAGKIVVQADKPGAKISPTFYGLMTEEINFSYDGGLYAELIRNRIFKDRPRGGSSTIPHWSVVTSEGAQGEISLDTTVPVNEIALTTSLKLNITSAAPGQRVGVANEGYWGIPVKPDTAYQASFYAKASGGFDGPLTVAIESNDGKTTYASATVPSVTNTWKKYDVALKTGQVPPTSAARFVISAASKGTLNFNLVSLFPPTYKNRVNGNRMDIMQLLADQKPTFLRFPGGNYVEGNDYANRWDWPRTIGPLEVRPGHMSPWGYRSTDGLGLLEYLEWCEDLDMEPVLAVFAAYTLNRQSYPGEYGRFVQEAVDEIEYVTGGTNTKWGARRAQDGHPAPFKLNYVEIGNEDPAGGRGSQVATYAQRFPLFYLAIKAKYPNLQIISTTRGNYGNYTPDVIDEHYYMDFNGALRNAHMYDNRPRTTSAGAPAPRIFVGEWATRDNRPTPSFHAALTDAAFLTGLERNADLVIMSCYAPLFDNVSRITGPGEHSQQWATDLIGYDALTAFGSPSYYVQKMFYNNKGDVVLPITVTPQIAPTAAAAPPAGARGGRGPTGPVQTIFASSSRDEATGDIILKVVNAVPTAQQMEIILEGVPTIGRSAKMEVLTGELTAVNTVAEPMKVAPKSSTIDVSGAKSVREFPGNSVTVIRFTTK